MPDGALPVLDVRDLKTVFQTRGGEVHAVNDVSFSLKPGELLGVVGESGSGKSVTMMSLAGLAALPPADVRGGHCACLTARTSCTYRQETAAVRARRQDRVCFSRPDDIAEPCLSGRFPNHGTPAQAHGHEQSARPRSARRNCWNWSAYLMPNDAWMTTPTSFPAVCASVS